LTPLFNMSANSTEFARRRGEGFHTASAEGSQLVSVTNQLKLIAADSKRYKTDVADTEQILRLIGRRCVGC
jgi:hypothetical protein